MLAASTPGTPQSLQAGRQLNPNPAYEYMIARNEYIIVSGALHGLSVRVSLWWRSIFAACQPGQHESCP